MTVSHRIAAPASVTAGAIHPATTEPGATAYGSAAEAVDTILTPPRHRVSQPARVVAGPMQPIGGEAASAPLAGGAANNLPTGDGRAGVPQIDATPPRAEDLEERDWADELGGGPDPEISEPSLPHTALDNQAMYRIIREVAVAWSGDAGYSAYAVSESLGLRFGVVLFPQASRHLGAVLRLMRSRDPEQFDALFGPDPEGLLAVTGSGTPAGRLAPVGGEPLWAPSWIERFRRAGGVPAFQAAQNEEAIEHQFLPMLAVAVGLGLTTGRGLAMAYDHVVARGMGGGLRQVVRVAGPLRTALQRSHALAMLGFPDLPAFQASVGLPADGVFGPLTHASLAGALRRQGAATLPRPSELECLLVAAASGRARWRLARLHDSTSLVGTTYDVTTVG
jgi:hypothetical protein